MPLWLALIVAGLIVAFFLAEGPGMALMVIGAVVLLLDR